MPSHSQQPFDKRLVIGITGRIGSGKTSVGNYLASRYTFQYLRYSQVLSEWRAKDPNGKAVLQAVGWEVMAGGLQSKLNDLLIARILPGYDVVVDGLRHPIDYQSLKDSFSASFHLMYIDSNLDDRWERLKNSGRYKTFQSLEAADTHPVEQEIESLRVKATLVIENKSALKDLYIVVDGAIQKFREEGLI